VPNPQASHNSPAPRPYRGRFAPSPTGLLHTGSLFTALASWLDARSSQGEWLLRMEDLDPPRESKAAADGILFALEALQLHWDGPVLYQSQRGAAFEEALARLKSLGRLFPCTCSRQDLGNHGPVYPGTCRAISTTPDQPHALRCRIDEIRISFDDRLQGTYAQHLPTDCGDFVVRRKDNLYAYQLAVVVDDAASGITDVVRGIDLLDSTPRQVFLQQLLGYPTPRYAHLPIVTDNHDDKLSKQQGARPVDIQQPSPALFRALQLLQQNPPAALQYEPPEAILQWAVSAWQPARLANLKRIREFQQDTDTAV
jgi:glutamyl-Q tRNA(Asp) synthetase